jgi:hypothetical protein
MQRSVHAMSRDLSRLRQRLLQTGEEWQRQLELLISERSPLIRGSFGTRRRVCGTPSCKCARGELHESKYLTASDEGKTRQVHVPADDEVMVAAGVDCYRRFHERRARLVALSQEQLELVDELGRSLLQPYPPDNPLPPPKRRGRPPKKPKG